MPLAGHDPPVYEQLHHESNPGCSEPLGSPSWEHRVGSSASHGLLGREATDERQEKRGAHDTIRRGTTPKDNTFFTTDSCSHCLVSDRLCRHKALLVSFSHAIVWFFPRSRFLPPIVSDYSPPRLPSR